MKHGRSHHMYVRIVGGRGGSRIRVLQAKVIFLDQLQMLEHQLQQDVALGSLVQLEAVLRVVKEDNLQTQKEYV